MYLEIPTSKIGFYCFGFVWHFRVIALYFLTDTLQYELFLSVIVIFLNIIIINIMHINLFARRVVKRLAWTNKR